MTENLNEFIREISEIYDSDSKDTYISLYFNKNTNQKFLDRRIKVCKVILKGEEQKNFTDTITDIEEKSGVTLSDIQGATLLTSLTTKLEKATAQYDVMIRAFIEILPELQKRENE